MVQNEKGVTLIELLAAITIFGIFSTIIWAFFFQSFHANNVELTKNSLQQEANLIINTFQEVHRNSESYLIVIDADFKTLEITPDSEASYLFNKSGVLYEISSTNSFESGDRIYPNNFDFPMTLILTSSENNNLQIKIQTVFSKIK
ncbi:type II secretion system protein J [Paenisporosarcina quisquiliarum]|uniref:PulJ/GspJ family protein n=1 Tax=Paenisporosarcina quisquiliarum TaxID=365346 RepID=UPI00373536C5